MKWIDKLPMLPLALGSIILLGAPFMPEPHIVEKVRMLVNGELSKPLDIFDLLMHSVPATILMIKLYRDYGRKSG